MRCPHCGGSANQHRVEIKRLQKQHEDFLHEFWETNAENERLRMSLEWWGRHLYNCASQNDMDCDCGFSEALEGGE